MPEGRGVARAGRPRWRKMTWVLAGWCALVVVVAVVLGVTAAHRCTHQPDQALVRAHGGVEVCHASVGVGIAVILVLGAVGLAVLSLIWLVSRPRRARVRARS